MIDVKPSLVFPNISTGDGTQLVIPLSDFSEQPLSAASVDPDTGDWRDILYSFLDEINAHFSDLPSENRPIMVSIRKSGSMGANNLMNYNFTVSITTQVSQENIPQEVNTP